MDGGDKVESRTSASCSATASVSTAVSTAAVTMVAPCSAYRLACAPPLGECTPTGFPAATARAMIDEITACMCSRSAGSARPRE